MLDSAAQEFRRPCCAAPRHKPRVAIRLLPTRKKSASADTYRERKVCRRDSREIEGWNAESAERVNTAPSSAALRAAFGQSHAQSPQRRGPHYLSRRLCANSGMRSKVALHRRSALSPATSDVVEVPGLQRVCAIPALHTRHSKQQRETVPALISLIFSQTPPPLCPRAPPANSVAVLAAGWLESNPREAAPFGSAIVRARSAILEPPPSGSCTGEFGPLRRGRGDHQAQLS